MSHPFRKIVAVLSGSMLLAGFDRVMRNRPTTDLCNSKPRSCSAMCAAGSITWRSI